MPARRAFSNLLAAAALVVPLVVARLAAGDQDLARARVLDQQGVRAYREERYNDAIRFFEEARKLGGPASEVWNIAKCHVRMDEPEEAVKSIEEYLDDKAISSADRAEAEQQLHEIEHRHSTLTVASYPAGGAVYVNGRRWSGTTPATIDVAPGDHKVTVQLAGYEPLEQSITAKFGRAVIVDARLTKSDSPGPLDHSAGGDAARRARARAHRVTLAGEVGVTVPRFGSIGGNAAPAGYLEGAYVPLDTPYLMATVGAAVTFTGDSWSNTSGLPNDNRNCGAAIPAGDGATALSVFLEGGIAWHVSPRWRVGGNLGAGIATYSMGEAGLDVFAPSCRPAPGVKPVFRFNGMISYALSSELRLLLAPTVIEAQPAFDGASPGPRDATGAWLRYGSAAGLAFDIF